LNQVPVAGNGNAMQQKIEKLAWTLIFVAGIAAALVVYTVLGRRITNADPSVFALAAKRLLAGQRLYVDFFEAKPLLATLFYTIPARLRPGSMTAISWLLAFFLMLQASLWLICFRPRLLVGASCLLFVVFYPATYSDFSWTSTEHMSNLFITIVLLVSFLAFREQRFSPWQIALAGAAACLAFHCRQNAVLCSLVPLGILATLPWDLGSKLKAAGWFAAGGFAAWIAVLGLALIISDLDGYFYQTFVFPRRMAQSGGNAERYMLMAEMGANSLPILAGLALGLGLLGRDRRLVLIAFPIGFLACLAAPRVHHHYWVNLFPYVVLSLLSGLPRDGAHTPILERVVSVALFACVGVGLLPLVSYALAPAQTVPLEEVATWVDAHSQPGDTLYVQGPMGTEHIQYHSRLLPANKYAISWELDWNDGLTLESFDEILGSYLQRPPTFFVIHEGQLAAAKAVAERPNTELEPGRNREELADRDGLALSSRLALELLAHHIYDEVKHLNGFRIYVLRRDAATEGGKSAG
jgi:hypothetical protein